MSHEDRVYPFIPEDRAEGEIEQIRTSAAELKRLVDHLPAPGVMSRNKSFAEMRSQAIEEEGNGSLYGLFPENIGYRDPIRIKNTIVALRRANVGTIERLAHIPRDEFCEIAGEEPESFQPKRTDLFPKQRHIAWAMKNLAVALTRRPR